MRYAGCRSRARRTQRPAHPEALLAGGVVASTLVAPAVAALCLAERLAASSVTARGRAVHLSVVASAAEPNPAPAARAHVLAKALRWRIESNPSPLPQGAGQNAVAPAESVLARATAFCGSKGGPVGQDRGASLRRFCGNRLVLRRDNQLPPAPGDECAAPGEPEDSPWTTRPLRAS